MRVSAMDFIARMSGEFLPHVRRNVGIVFQESFLFSNTVAANIAFGSPSASREQIDLKAIPAGQWWWD